MGAFALIPYYFKKHLQDFIINLIIIDKFWIILIEIVLLGF